MRDGDAPRRRSSFSVIARAAASFRASRRSLGFEHDLHGGGLGIDSRSGVRFVSPSTGVGAILRSSAPTTRRTATRWMLGVRRPGLEHLRGAGLRRSNPCPSVGSCPGSGSRGFTLRGAERDGIENVRDPKVGRLEARTRVRPARVRTPSNSCARRRVPNAIAGANTTWAGAAGLSHFRGARSLRARRCEGMRAGVWVVVEVAVWVDEGARSRRTVR